jgi:hypothetical protein
LRGDRCDQHCVASQPVRRLETLPSDLLEMPANCGVLRFNGRPPGTDLGHFRLGLAASLRRILEIFPFLGDRRRRPGSICTVWPSLQCNSPNPPSWPPANLECRARTAAPKRGAMVEAVQTAAGTITYGDLAPRIYRLAALHRQMGDANLIAIRDVR